MVDSLKDGKRKATAGSSTHARVYALLFSATDDLPFEKIVWMPAHQGKKAIGKRTKSDGTYLTAEDVEFNDYADRYAKRGVEDHRVPVMVRDSWRRCLEEVKSRAMWIGRVNSLANNLPVPPYSDSCSSRAAAEKSKRAKTRARLAALLGDVAKPPVTARPPLLGGHILKESSYGGVKQWRCITCKASSFNWCELAPAKCRGSAAEKWALASVAAAEAGGSVGPGHHRMLAGDTVWCLKCGCYGGDRARGLADVCHGKPTDKSGGGLAGQLNYLMRGLHPRTREKLPGVH